MIFGERDSESCRLSVDRRSDHATFEESFIFYRAIWEINDVDALTCVYIVINCIKRDRNSTHVAANHELWKPPIGWDVATDGIESRGTRLRWGAEKGILESDIAIRSWATGTPLLRNCENYK